MATRADDLATTFRTWAATGEVALHRTAYLLTGDLATARLQVRDALGAALATRPGDPADLDEAALRALLSNRTSAGSDRLRADSDDVTRCSSVNAVRPSRPSRDSTVSSSPK